MNMHSIDLKPDFITDDDKEVFDQCKLIIGELTKQLTYYAEYFNLYDDEKLNETLKSLSNLLNATIAENTMMICQYLSEGKYLKTIHQTSDFRGPILSTLTIIRKRIPSLRGRLDDVSNLINIYHEINSMIRMLAEHCKKHDRMNVNLMKIAIRNFIKPKYLNLFSLTKQLKGIVMRGSHLPHDIAYISETDVKKEDEFVKAWLKDYLKTAYNPNNDYANVVKYFNIQNVDLDHFDDITLKRDVLPWLGLTDFLAVEKQLITIKKQQAIERPIRLTDADTKHFDHFDQRVFNNAWHSMVVNITDCVDPMLAEKLPVGLVLRYCNIVRDVAERLAREFHTKHKTINRVNNETLYRAICYAVLSLFLGHMEVDLNNSCIKNIVNNIDIIRIGHFILRKIISPGEAEFIDFDKYNKMIIDLVMVEPPALLPSSSSGLGLPHRPPLGGGKTRGKTKGKTKGKTRGKTRG